MGRDNSFSNSSRSFDALLKMPHASGSSALSPTLFCFRRCEQGRVRVQWLQQVPLAVIMPLPLLLSHHKNMFLSL
jgi:hypothetical protein